MNAKSKRKMILGAILRQERTSRHISQATLGHVAGVGKTTISAYELGKISPDIETLDLICSYMNLDYIDVLRRAQRMYKTVVRVQNEVDMYRSLQNTVVDVVNSFTEKEEKAPAEPTVSAAQ